MFRGSGVDAHVTVELGTAELGDLPEILPDHKLVGARGWTRSLHCPPCGFLVLPSSFLFQALASSRGTVPSLDLVKFFFFVSNS